MLKETDEGRKLIEEFISNGGKVKRGKLHKPRNDEKSFRNNRSSVFNRGHQRSKLRHSFSQEAVR
jgi:hypothetical protein